ncbi:hypothetical protein CIB48_g4953 [Xylaria polymorpha]|nr:hypothetical protein CIB48_g4953 [Xylaria polymorpha]
MTSKEIATKHLPMKGPALFKPTQPLQIFTARHIPRGFVNTSRNKWRESMQKREREYREFTQFQGRLTEDREISFVCIPGDDIHPLRERLYGRFCPVKHCYISIPFNTGDKPMLAQPWALVLPDEPIPGYTYEDRLNRLLADLNLTGCGFERTSTSTTATAPTLRTVTQSISTPNSASIFRVAPVIDWQEMANRTGFRSATEAEVHWGPLIPEGNSPEGRRAVRSLSAAPSSYTFTSSTGTLTPLGIKN